MGQLSLLSLLQYWLASSFGASGRVMKLLASDWLADTFEKKNYKQKMYHPLGERFTISNNTMRLCALLSLVAVAAARSRANQTRILIMGDSW